MRVATLRGEESVADLARRLFRISGPGAEARAREAEAALLRANPHLRELARAPEGTVIVVPEVPGTNPTEESQPVGLAGTEMMAEVRRAIGDMRRALQTSATRQADEARGTLELLESHELRTAAERDPALTERLPAIAESARARLEEARALQALQEQALAQLDRDLEDLRTRLAP